MRHFVQYHNSDPDKMGSYRPSTKNFGIVTNKLQGVGKGDIVWLLTGEGRPREYFLCETFSVEKISPQSVGRFSYRISSEDGQSLYRLELDKTSSWFQELLKITGNFRYGLQRISSEAIIAGLKRAAAKG